jgi:hypothetical protein
VGLVRGRAGAGVGDGEDVGHGGGAGHRTADVMVSPA